MSGYLKRAKLSSHTCRCGESRLAVTTDIPGSYIQDIIGYAITDGKEEEQDILSMPVTFSKMFVSTAILVRLVHSTDDEEARPETANVYKRRGFFEFEPYGYYMGSNGRAYQQCKACDNTDLADEERIWISSEPDWWFQNCPRQQIIFV